MTPAFGPGGSGGSAGTHGANAPTLADWSATGRGTALGHHGELLQGVFSEHGRLHRGLVTLPCGLFTSHVEARLTSADPELTVEPKWKTKALRAARATIDDLGFGPLGGMLRVNSDIEVGRGFGSSTSDVTATIRAVADALDRDLAPATIARIAVLAEVAADPLMYDRMVLFAHREGDVLEDYGVPMCPFQALGFAVLGKPVDTLELPRARYLPEQIDLLAGLRRTIRIGVLNGDLDQLGKVATASALINQEFQRSAHFPELLQIVEETRAAGIQVAHSGNVASILFVPGRPRLDRRVAQAARLLAQLGVTETWRFGNEQ